MIGTHPQIGAKYETQETQAYVGQGPSDAREASAKAGNEKWLATGCSGHMRISNEVDELVIGCGQR